MNTVYIVAALVFVAAVLAIFMEEEELWYKFTFVLFISSCGFTAVLLLVAFLSIFIPQVEYLGSYTIPIYSGYNDGITEGRYFLLSGYINEVDTVFYWEQEADGALVKKSVPMRHTKFYEEDRKDGAVEISNYGCINDEWYFCYYKHSEYSFHVPFGSIISEYGFR